MQHFYRVGVLPGKYRITEREGDEPYEVSNGQWERIIAEPYTIGTLDCSRLGKAITPPTPTDKPATLTDEDSDH